MGTLEELVREAGEARVGELDVAAVRGRMTRRRRRRVAVSTVAAVVALSLAIGVVVAATDADHDAAPARRVGAPATTPTVSWHQVVPPPGRTGVVGGPGGNAIAVDRTTISHTTDLQSWTTTFEVPVGPGGAAAETLTQAFATSFGFVVTGDGGSTERQAVIWFSPDGTFWARADTDAFLAPSDEARKAGYRSDVYDVTQQGGQLVAVGEVRTGTRNQPYGLAPCIWVSHDGLNWTRRLIHLGNGFDPYVSWILPRGGGYIAGGQIDKAAAMWTTTDLIRWHRVKTAPRSGIQPLVTADGYVGLGAVVVREPKVVKHVIVRDAVIRPAIWRSSDGTRWRRTLTLAPRHGSDTEFMTLGEDGETLVLVVQPYEGDHPPQIFTSSNGRSWGRSATAADQFPPGTSFEAGGADEGTIVLTGRNGSTPVAWQSGGG